ncbi:MAG: AbgT family transporter [Planctomycetota bacterium]
MTDAPPAPKSGLLGWIERIGNKLPDPTLLFVFALVATWVLSWVLGDTEFQVQSTEGVKTQTIVNQLTPTALVAFLAGMVKTFTGFHPLGVVLVALLGVGVAEHSGFKNAILKRLHNRTPRMFLTPMLLLVAIVSHTAADAGYVLVIPLGGVIFYAAGRHPIAGIVCAFAGVSGGFSANFIPSGIDPLLQGFTQSSAQIQDSTREVNPLCNLYFTGASSLLIIAIGWFLTDRVIEPRLKSTAVDGDPEDMPKMEEITREETNGMVAGIVAMLIGAAILVFGAWPSDSPFRSPAGELTAFSAPLMQSIVPIIFLLFLLPGVVHGYVSGTFKNHRDVINAMSKTMGTMSHYMVMAFAAALFLYAFTKSNLGAYLAVQGAEVLKSAGMPSGATIVGIIGLCAIVNLLVGSASAKWGLLAPIFVPMLMQLGISPELTQAAYRVGDSSTNIVTPLMPYFPLIVAFSKRYVKDTGIGTLISLMLPYSIAFLICWTGFLLLFWALGLPLGLGATYEYAPGG